MNAVNLPAKVPVLFDHDGSADDFLSLLLLLTMEAVDLQGVSITPADCYAEHESQLAGAEPDARRGAHQRRNSISLLGEKRPRAN